ncbi:Methionyl-tRNA formyltransferase [Morus notabilis]|uniref:methionyl-tRNA formyltransferase n=1 Tax=Morus notabilis TaxID=981085 RepID=W9R7X6_9ROSA|nr:Methionyl-tRNA formyltransferase [Morus notabilis]
MNSSLMLRRFCCFTTSTSSSSSSTLPISSNTTKKKQIVFLGSPQVSTTVLDALFNASTAPESSFQVAAIVTQPPSRRDRGKKLLPSPIAQFALDRNFPSDFIFTPERAGEEIFLSNLRELKPELCITAAYGNILPRKFLNIPPLGTVNIHPSLLPLYRGAAPVQRALQAPDLLAVLFSEGAKLLIRELPSILDGSAKGKASPQDDSKATLAPKIEPEESWLSFNQEATVLHNKVRAFAGWPGTRAKVVVVEKGDSSLKVLELKIITTRVCSQSNLERNEADDVTFLKGALIFPCGQGTTLEVLEVQLPGKKVMNAAAFWNGLRGQKLKVSSQEKGILLNCEDFDILNCKELIYYSIRFYVYF